MFQESAMRSLDASFRFCKSTKRCIGVIDKVFSDKVRHGTSKTICLFYFLTDDIDKAISFRLATAMNEFLSIPRREV